MSEHQLRAIRHRWTGNFITLAALGALLALVIR